MISILIPITSYLVPCIATQGKPHSLVALTVQWLLPADGYSKQDYRKSIYIDVVLWFRRAHTPISLLATTQVHKSQKNVELISLSMHVFSVDLVYSMAWTFGGSVAIFGRLASTCIIYEMHLADIKFGNGKIMSCIITHFVMWFCFPVHQIIRV